MSPNTVRDGQAHTHSIPKESSRTSHMGIYTASSKHLTYCPQALFGRFLLDPEHMCSRTCLTALVLVALLSNLNSHSPLFLSDLLDRYHYIKYRYAIQFIAEIEHRKAPLRLGSTDHSACLTLTPKLTFISTTRVFHVAFIWGGVGHNQSFRKDCRFRRGSQSSAPPLNSPWLEGGSGASTFTAQRSIAIERTLIEGIMFALAEIMIEIITINGIHIYRVYVHSHLLPHCQDRRRHVFGV